MKLLEKEFYDYKTAPVSGSDVVDLHRTGMSYYDDFLSNDASTLNYLRNEKNLEGEVVMMSPSEYFQACSDYGFPNSHPSVEKLKKERQYDIKTLNHLKDVLTIYKKRFPMPILNKADHGQEGLHRMMVIGDMFGWDHKVPVLVVDWADKQKAFEIEKRKRVEKIRSKIKQAIVETLRYTFYDMQEVEQQLQWELDKQFEFEEDFNVPVNFELSQKDDDIIVSIGAASVEFDYNDIKFKEIEQDDIELDAGDISIDDIDLEETEDFLKRYFGDDWRKTHPHLKDTFNIKEEFDSDINKIDNIIVDYWGARQPW